MRKNLYVGQERHSAHLLHAAVSVNSYLWVKCLLERGGNQVPAINQLQYFLMPCTLRTMGIQEKVHLIQLCSWVLGLILPMTVCSEFSFLSDLLERKKEDGTAQSNQKREFRGASSRNHSLPGNREWFRERLQCCLHTDFHYESAWGSHLLCSSCHFQW